MKDRSPFGMAASKKTGRTRPLGAHLRNHHDRRQRVGRRNSRPDATDLAPAYCTRWLSDELGPGHLMGPFPPNQCRCGRSRRASASRRTTIPQSSSRSKWSRAPWTRRDQTQIQDRTASVFLPKRRSPGRLCASAVSDNNASACFGAFYAISS